MRIECEFVADIFNGEEFDFILNALATLNDDLVIFCLYFALSISFYLILMAMRAVKSGVILKRRVVGSRRERRSFEITIPFSFGFLFAFSSRSLRLLLEDCFSI